MVFPKSHDTSVLLLSSLHSDSNAQVPSLRGTILQPAEEVDLRYKDLLLVEDAFRTMKSILETRPIYHKCDDTIRGHVFCSFLALVLQQELQSRLESRGWITE